MSATIPNRPNDLKRKMPGIKAGNAGARRNPASATVGYNRNRTGTLTQAQFRCNKCGRIVGREYGWKLWIKSFCYITGKDARLYRVSEPKK